MKILKYLLYSTAFFVFFSSVLPARAFEISPVKSLFTVDPNSSQTIVIKIKNSEKNDLSFKLDVLGVTQDSDGKPIFSRGVDAAESWVYPENNLISIKSGETKSVNFFIKTPADAVSGSYYLGLTVEPVLPKNTSIGGQQNLATKLVSLLTLEVKGLVRESLVIEKFSPLENISDNKIWKFDLNFKNNGTIEVLSQGVISVRNWRGEEIFSEPVVLGNKLLAGSKRVLHPEVVLKNNINFPGLYSARIKINYGRTNQTVSEIAYIWYFPAWSKIIFGVIVLLVAFSVFWKAKKSRQ